MPVGRAGVRSSSASARRASGRRSVGLRRDERETVREELDVRRLRGEGRERPPPRLGHGRGHGAEITHAGVGVAQPVFDELRGELGALEHDLLREREARERIVRTEGREERRLVVLAEPRAEERVTPHAALTEPRAERSPRRVADEGAHLAVEPRRVVEHRERLDGHLVGDRSQRRIIAAPRGAIEGLGEAAPLAFEGDAGLRWSARIGVGRRDPEQRREAYTEHSSKRAHAGKFTPRGAGSKAP